MHGLIPEFRPHALLTSGHAQTLAGAFWKGSVGSYRARQHVISLPDGDRVLLHDDSPPSWQPPRRVALLIHGLGGSYASPYVSRIAAKLNARGVRTFRLDMRGCGAGWRLADHPGHAGRSEDVAAALDTIARLCPGSPIAAVGFSLGGNLLLKLLGEVGNRFPVGLDSALAIAPPIDLTFCSRNIERRERSFYNQAFIRSLMRQVRLRRRLVPAIAKIPLHPRPRTQFEFDDRFTAPLSGFASAEEYYARSSATPLLPHIQLPTRIITAADDPLVPCEIFDAVRLSPTTQLVVTKHGGHLGYIGGASGDPDRRWLDWLVIDWVALADSHFTLPTRDAA